METQVLSRVVFVKDPTALPKNVKHHEAIESLAAVNKVVILLSHGNKYILPPAWIFPHNVSLFEYEITMESIVNCVRQIKELLLKHHIGLYSRHLDNEDPMPILLAGACLTLGAGTEVSFINKPDEYTNTTVTPTKVEQSDVDWDLLN